MPNGERPQAAVAERDTLDDSGAAPLPQLDVIADEVRDVLCLADTQGKLF